MCHFRIRHGVRLRVGVVRAVTIARFSRPIDGSLIWKFQSLRGPFPLPQQRTAGDNALDKIKIDKVTINGDALARVATQRAVQSLACCFTFAE